jgi:hypothetical protein
LGGFCSPGDYAILKFLPNSRHYLWLVLRPSRQIVAQSPAGQ